MLHKISPLRPYLSILFFCLALVFYFASAAQAQSALDGFDPNANGVVQVVTVQPDGKILIGGDFTTLAPNGGAAVTRNRIARLNPDGTLDTAFNPNANNTVYSIVVQADGRVLAGGDFTAIGGQTRNRIARLDPVTGLADSFDPNATSGIVFSIAVQPDGKILAGGSFTTIGGQTRSGIARLDAATGSADSFDANANNAVRTIALQADGRVLAGGFFTSIGGLTRNHIARLDAVTGMADSFDPNANNIILSIAVQADGKIVAGGSFFGANSISGQTRNRIARLDAVTGMADSFDPNANSSVFAIRVLADGRLLAGGFFTSIGGQTRNRIARLDAATGMADPFDPNADSFVLSIAVQQDGKVLAGGGFTTLAPNGGAVVTRNRIARLEMDGRLDRTLDLAVGGTFVETAVVQADGKILIGGIFTSVLSVTRNNIVRLNSDGTLDTAFNPNADGAVSSIAVQPDGRVLAGGTFSSIGGQTRSRIARLDAVTGLADSFDPNADNTVTSIVAQADGKILVAGGFTNIGGQIRNRIARLDAATGTADSFDPNANNGVLSIAVQADGKVLAGGHFTMIGGQSRSHIARLDAATGLADTFDPNANDEITAIAIQINGRILAGGQFTNIGGQPRNSLARLDPITGAADAFNANANSGEFVWTIVVQADGKILVGGNFTNIGGQSRSRIARLDAVTGLADAFDPNATGSQFPNVYALALQADGKVLAGGAFTGIGGQPRERFARLSNDTAAMQSLTVTQTTAAWSRGGSSPQFTRVTFELSTDNVNYTLLGNGTASGGIWTLTGLNLPTGQNIYIRARGRYRGSLYTGSESIQESVRNAFIIPGPTITGTVTYGNAIGPPKSRFVSNVLLSGAGSIPVSALTGFPGGTYSLNGFGSGSYTVTPSKTGGVNSITSFDAAKIAQHAAGISTLTGNQLIVADVSGDGTISSFDAGQIARYVIAVGGSGSTGNWIFMPVNRSYATVTTNIADQDFIALLMGEVSGNWINAGAMAR